MDHKGGRWDRGNVMAARRILVALVVVSSAFIAPAGAQTPKATSGEQFSALGRAAVLAHAASLAQVAGIPRTIELDLPTTSRSASEAVTALASRGGMILSLAQREQVASLDRLDDELQRGIAATIQAFSVFATATSAGTLADVVAARGLLLDAVVTLKTSVPVMTNADGACEAFEIPGILMLDTAGCDNTYDAGFVRLSIDVGGDDVYYNNAGGSRYFGDYSMDVSRYLGGAAAAIDLGGDDDYLGDTYYANNGGAGCGFCPPRVPYLGSGIVPYLYAGFLLDAAGNDVYRGYNGGAEGYFGYLPISPYPPGPFRVWLGMGSGFLLDVGGDDAYYGKNGSAVGLAEGLVPLSRGLLFDADGFDVYAAGIESSYPRYNECTRLAAQIDFPHTGCP